MRNLPFATARQLAFLLLVSSWGPSVTAAPHISLGVEAVVVGPEVRGQAQTPPPQTQAEIQQAQLQEELKDLQRRERRTTNLREREALLDQILVTCIELVIDCSGYKKDLSDVRAELDKQNKDAAKAQAVEARIETLKTRAREAIEANPPRWDEAWRHLSLIPARSRDEDVRSMVNRVRQGQRNQLYRRIAIVVLLTIVALALMIPALKALGKGVRPRELEMIEGPAPGEVFRLEKEMTSLGAIAPDADIVITDPFRKISRRHCEIAKSGKHHFLTDCSTNGTLINGKAIPKGEPVLLKKNDRIALAEDVVLRFR